jgi:hypothetical protein
MSAKPARIPALQVIPSTHSIAMNNPAGEFAKFVNRDNVRMMQRGGRARFGFESVHCLRAHAEMHPQNLQNHGRLRPGVAREVNFAHAAHADQGFDAVMANALAREKAAGIPIQQIAGQMRGRRVQEEPGALGVRLEQPIDFGAQIRGVSTGAIEKCFVNAVGEPQRFEVQPLDLLPPFGIHEDLRLISRISQVRAMRQSRLTVTTETPSASAVSSMLNPPK